jgi:hypothetical protein
MQVAETTETRVNLFIVIYAASSTQESESQ